MKYIFKIPIFILVLFASGYSFASSTSCAMLSDGDIEAFVTNACSGSSATGKIDLRINTNTGPWEVTYLDNNNIVFSTKVHIIDGNGGEEDMLNLLPGTYRVEVVDSRCDKAVLDVDLGVIGALVAIHPNACAVVDGGSLSETQLRNAIQVHPASVVKFYPNPFTKGINLDIDSPQRDVVNIVVNNAVGSVMFKSKVDVEAGQNVKYLNEFEQLPSGVYTVKLKSDLMDHILLV